MEKSFISFFILLFILLFPGFIQGQTKTEDVVYLKNGNIVRGTITEQTLNQSVKIETKDKSLFVFSMEEIDKITRESIATPRKTATKPTTPSLSDTISIVKNRLFYQHGIRLSHRELKLVLRSNPEAYSHYKTANGYSTAANVFMVIGATTVLGGVLVKDMATKLILCGSGLGIELIGVLISTGYRPNMRMAVKTYNKGLKDTKQTTASVRIGLTNYGMGITVGF